MRLKKIKLAGFKSFVDPTTIPINASLIGVVGPNGCGKSNIIDAVRWVMGESSAKHLRGDSMADVIFSGSNTRKPVGKATVELIFENKQGKAPGQYASFTEISIKRETSRDGNSDYSINKTRCRRKDITDLFLGTGLGPRAYSIIEQGMVTRIIEAKPEELRGFFEEAAGISRYKERRRETENRMRHTRENLERVEDIRRELDTQIQKLQRQSKAAAKYKDLKQNERQIQAQLIVLRWQKLSTELKQKDATLSQKQTELDAVIATQREIEARIEALRSKQLDANDNLSKVQEKFYSVGAEVNNIEQKIQHAKDTRRQQQREQQQVNQQWQEASDHLTEDKSLLSDLETQLASAKPNIETAQQQFNEALKAMTVAESDLQNWQQEWQSFSEIAAEPEKAAEIQRSRIQHIKPQIEQLKLRLSRLQAEQQTLNETLAQENIDQLRLSAEAINKRSADLEQQLETLETKIQDDRIAVDSGSAALDVEKNELHGLNARLESLRELQATAEGKHDDQLANWLNNKNLSAKPRLSGNIQVEAGWEKAVERVLGNALAAICVDKLDPVIGDLESLKASSLAVLENTSATHSVSEDSLLKKIQSEFNLFPLAGKVKFAEDLTDANKRRSGLADDESIVTRSGILLGSNWISMINQEGANAGILARAREIESIESKLSGLEEKINQQQADLDGLRLNIKDQENNRDGLRKLITETTREKTEILTELGKRETQVSQTESRLKQISNDVTELEGVIEENNSALTGSIKILEDAEGMSGTHADKRDLLESRQVELKEKLALTTASANDKRDGLHRLEIDHQRINTVFESTQQGIERLESQLSQLGNRRQELIINLSKTDNPELALKAQLEEHLGNQVTVEKDMTSARKVVADLDEDLRDQEKKRTAQEEQAQLCRQGMEQNRIDRQEVIVRRDTLEEKLAESNLTVEQVLADMPEQANAGAWQEESDKIARRISRLGPINLVAIEEFEEQSERKTYLDKQFDDLAQALATLEEAIQKIDRETRTRFKETFDKVNTGFQAYFPKLFGGGHAYLELTGNDLLDTGVTVMARPPGKRNSTIHLLSGGEKALTAVSLIFSIFQLNPAPFCLLDEVDAPLDDANVERYSEILKQLSGETQLLYVTHNKITMETADLLLGVTMSEPGVSRLVAVDVEEAMEMVV